MRLKASSINYAKRYGNIMNLFIFFLNLPIFFVKWKLINNYNN